LVSRKITTTTAVTQAISHHGMWRRINEGEPQLGQYLLVPDHFVLHALHLMIS
jgi:hypothetical protein